MRKYVVSVGHFRTLVAIITPNKLLVACIPAVHMI
jgi:hypothetical protein